MLNTRHVVCCVCYHYYMKNTLVTDVLAKCALNSHLFNFFFFLYNGARNLNRVPLLQKVTLPWLSLAITFLSSCHLVFWGHFLGLLILLCTKFSTLFKKLSCSNSCLIPSKLFQNSLAFFIFSKQISRQDVQERSCLTHLKASSGGLSSAVQYALQNPSNEPLLPPHMEDLCSWLAPFRLVPETSAAVCNEIIYCFITEQRTTSQRGAVNKCGTVIASRKAH